MKNISKLEQVLRALGNKRRLKILTVLKKNKSMTVTDIARSIDAKIYPTSQHIRVLRSFGIINGTRRGKYVSYRISLNQEEPVKTILSLL